MNRRDVNSFEDLLNISKQVEIKLLNIKKYKEPLLQETILLTNAAWHGPVKEDPKRLKDSKIFLSRRKSGNIDLKQKLVR